MGPLGNIILTLCVCVVVGMGRIPGYVLIGSALCMGVVSQTLSYTSRVRVHKERSLTLSCMNTTHASEIMHTKKDYLFGMSPYPCLYWCVCVCSSSVLTNPIWSGPEQQSSCRPERCWLLCNEMVACGSHCLSSPQQPVLLPPTDRRTNYTHPTSCKYCCKASMLC
jgi:hypothetical protein